jgi:hypothetical protein
VRPLKAYHDRLIAELGYVPEHSLVQEAVNQFRHYPMQKVRSELVELEQEFGRMGGLRRGRGIELAADIDALKISIAVRGRK